MFATESQVRSLVLPSDIVATNTWKPIPHSDVLNVVESQLEKAGIRISNGEKRFTLVSENAKMFATIPLDYKIDDNASLMLGIANSWDKSISLKIGFGSRVFVCSNGAFFAEKVIGKRHAPANIEEIPALILEALSQTESYATQQRGFFQRLREIEMIDKDVHDFVVRSAIEHDCVPAREIANVIEEYRKPSHDEFNSRNAYSLFNAYTEISKGIESKNGNTFSERLVRLSGMFADEFASDLKLSATRKVVVSEVVDEVAASN